MSNNNIVKVIVNSGPEKLMNWSQSHPLVVMMVLMTISILAITQLGKVWIDTSAKSMMMAKDPAIPFYHDTLEKFGSDNVTAIYVQDPELFTPEKLAILDRLVLDLEKINGVTKTESLFTVNNFKYDNFVLYTGPLMDKVPVTINEAVNVKRDALLNPILKKNLISRDGTATAINIYTGKKSEEYYVSYSIAQSLEKTIAPYRQNFETLFQIGKPYSDKTQYETVRRDQHFIFPVSIGIILVTLTFSMRSFSAFILPLLTSGVSVLWTFGFMGAAGLPVGIFTSIIPAMNLIIGSTEDMHILSEFMTGMDRTKDRKKAVSFMAENVGTALLLTAGTTIVGFLCISMNNIIALKQFGITGAFSMFVNAIVTFLLAPVYLRFFGPKFHPGETGNLKRSLFEKLAGKFSAFVHRFAKPISVSSIIIALAWGIYGLNVNIESSLMSFFKKDSEIIKRVGIIENSLAGTGSFYIRITGSPGDFSRPENLMPVENFLRSLHGMKYFDKAITLNHFIKLIHREMNGGRSDYYIIPENPDTLAEYLFLLHREDIRQYVTADYSELNIFVRHHIYSSRLFNEAVEKLEITAAQELPFPFEVKFTGEQLLVDKAVDTLVQGQIYGVVILLLVIFTLFSLLFKQIKMGIIAMVTNSIPVLIIFGIMTLWDIPLNTGTCMVAVIALGLGADDTIHLFIRYYKDRKRLIDKKAALKATIQSEFRPISCTSVALALGFSALCFSEFVPIIQLGFLCASVMTLAFISDMIISPALLMLFDTGRSKKIICILLIAGALCFQIFPQASVLDAATVHNDANTLLLEEFDQMNDEAADTKSVIIPGQLYDNFNGSIRLEWQHILEDSNTNSDKNILEGRINARTFMQSENMRLFLSGWIEGSTQQNIWNGTSDFIQDKQNEKSSLELNEAFITYYGDRLNLYAGKMIIPNTLSTIYSPADLYEPEDYHDPFNSQKLGMWALKLDYGSDDYTLTTAVMPVFRASKLPVRDSIWTATDVDLVVNKPDINVGNFSYLIRLNKTGGGYDLFGSAFYGLYSNYSLGISDSKDSLGIWPSLVLIDDPERLLQFAGGFSTVHKNFEFHGEAVYSKNTEGVDNRYLSYVIGTTYTVKNPSALFMDSVILSLEYSGEWVHSRDTSRSFSNYLLENNFLDNTLFYRLIMELNKNHAFTVTGGYHISNRDSAAQLKWRYKLNEDCFISTALDTLSVNNPDNIIWEDNDRISVAFEYFF
jgi:predicted RND superfamily exporter protein